MPALTVEKFVNANLYPWRCHDDTRIPVSTQGIVVSQIPSINGLVVLRTPWEGNYLLCEQPNSEVKHLLNDGRRLTEVENRAIADGKYRYLVDVCDRDGIEAVQREIDKLNRQQTTNF